LRIENHVVNFSRVQAGVAALLGQPIGLKRDVKEVCEEDKKKNAN